MNESSELTRNFNSAPFKLKWETRPFADRVKYSEILDLELWLNFAPFEAVSKPLDVQGLKSISFDFTQYGPGVANCLLAIQVSNNGINYNDLDETLFTPPLNDTPLTTLNPVFVKCKDITAKFIRVRVFNAEDDFTGNTLTCDCVVAEL